MTVERAGQEFMEFARQAFQATLDAASKIQQQTQQLMEALIRQGTGAQEEGKRLFSDWVEESRRHTEEFQKAAAEGYRKWEGEVNQRLARIRPATTQEVQELRQRVDELVRRIEALENR
jgi:polyhydroxyalkanoate synthesis regulator phasin